MYNLHFKFFLKYIILNKKKKKKTSWTLKKLKILKKKKVNSNMIQTHSSTITTFVVNLIWTMNDYNFCYNFDMINYE